MEIKIPNGFKLTPKNEVTRIRDIETVLFEDGSFEKFKGSSLQLLSNVVGILEPLSPVQSETEVSEG